MLVSPEQVESRREFFRAAARYTLLGCLTVAASLTARRSLRGQRCVNLGVCSGCPAFAGCELPNALSAKQGRKT